MIRMQTVVTMEEGKKKKRKTSHQVLVPSPLNPRIAISDGQPHASPHKPAWSQDRGPDVQAWRSPRDPAAAAGKQRPQRRRRHVEPVQRPRDGGEGGDGGEGAPRRHTLRPAKPERLYCPQKTSA